MGSRGVREPVGCAGVGSRGVREGVRVGFRGVCECGGPVGCVILWGERACGMREGGVPWGA